MSKQLEICKVPQSTLLPSDVVVCSVPVLEVMVTPDTEKPWTQAVNGKSVDGVELQFEGDSMSPETALAFQCVLLKYKLPTGWQWFGKGIALKNNLTLPFEYNTAIQADDPSVLDVSIGFETATEVSLVLDFRFCAQMLNSNSNSDLAVYYSQDPVIDIRRPPPFDVN